MSYRNYEEFDQNIRIQLQDEMDLLCLSSETKDEILGKWKAREKTFAQQVREWGDREISLTFSNTFRVILIVVLLLGGWILTNRSYIFFKGHDEQFVQKNIIYVNVVKNQNGEIPLSEQGEMYLRKEYE